MRDHNDDPKIQASGAWALSVIGVDEDNCANIGENGGINVIVESMQDCDNLVLKERVCGFSMRDG